jgi:hypothetical protein
MALPGRKPSDRPIVHRNKPAVDWTDVTDEPYTGPSPDLPEVRQIVDKNGLVSEIPYSNATRKWWSSVSSMPHCVLWHNSDWAYALDTAVVHDQASYGSVSAMAELRLREKSLGTTFDARRDLRIRYVEPETESLAIVDELDDRRRRLLDA